MLKVFIIVLFYYPLSIGLTFFQKSFLTNFHYPLIVVTGHYITKYLVGYIGRWMVECRKKTKRVRLSFRDQLRYIAPIGICASFDIGLSNWALEYITISLYTMTKSSSILFILFFSIIFKIEKLRLPLAINSLLIAAGLFLFTWKAEQLNVIGLFLVTLASLCSGVRWAVSQLVMQRDDSQITVRNPLDMIMHVQPWMLLAILPLAWFFEGAELMNESKAFDGYSVVLNIFLGGLLAFFMELSEYLLLVNTSGITLNIFGIVKELMTLLLAHYLNHDKLSFINMIGLVLCLTGMIFHAVNKHKKALGSNRINVGSDAEDARRLLLAEVNEIA
uniref:TPT domain-containing protein n=1 Tax=Rhabditophanes sp. KR3021 TaxID=114890 RepID=A0AC35U9L8_9BILA